jgi:hypothetical protein
MATSSHMLWKARVCISKIILKNKVKISGIQKSAFQVDAGKQSTQ